MSVKYRPALIIPDTQIPYHHPDTVGFLTAVAKEIRAEQVYHVGDEVDMQSLSRFARQPDLPESADEWRKSVKTLRQLQKIFPKVRCCYSNHTGRVFKRLQEVGIPSGWLKSLAEIYELPGWQWAKSWQIPTIYGSCTITHGLRKTGAFNRAKQTGTSHVSGHHHSLFGLQFFQTVEGGMRFGMNVGSLVNMKSLAFKYAEESLYESILGCGVVVGGMPHLVPMITTGSGRWNKKVTIL